MGSVSPPLEEVLKFFLEVNFFIRLEVDLSVSEHFANTDSLKLHTKVVKI
jgi:hypothetical protein